MPTKLRQVHIAVFKDRSGTDDSKVALVSSASAAKVYKQGAYVAASAGPIAAGPGGTVVTVRDAGRLSVGDTVQKGMVSTATATVLAINSRTSITLASAVGSLSLVSGDRLVDTSNRPTLYDESTGAHSTGSSNVATDTNGIVVFYATEGIVDILFSTDGGSTISGAKYDVEAGYVMPKPWLDVRDFASLLEAYNAAPSTGAIIHIPAGTTCEISAAMDVSKPVIFQGDGAVAGSIIRTSVADPNHHMFNVTTGAQFRGLEIDMRATVADSYDAIRVHGHGVNNIDVANFQMYDVYIHHTPRNGLRITEIIDSHFEKVLLSHCYGDAYMIQQSSGGSDPVNGGYTVTNNTNLVFIDCRAADCFKRGIYVDGMYRPVFIGCTFEALGEAASLGGAGGTTGTGATDGLCYFKNVSSGTWIGCHSEGFWTYGTRAYQAWYFESCAGGIVHANAVECISGDFGTVQLAPFRGMLFQTCGDMHVAGNRVLGFTQNSIVVASDSPRMIVQQPNYGTSTDRVLISAPTATLIGGLGLKLPVFADNTARDNATTGAYVATGTIIFVDSPSSPASQLQIYDGSAWVGIAKWTGAAAAAI